MGPPAFTLPDMADGGANSEQQIVLDILDRLRAPTRRSTIALSSLVFGGAVCGAIVTIWLWTGLALASQKTLGVAARDLFGTWDHIIVAGSLVLVPTTLALSIISWFRPIRWWFFALAGGLVVIWPRCFT